MKRPIILSLLVTVGILVSYAVPKEDYTGVNVLDEIHIPTSIPGWDSQDVSSQLNLQDDRYHFISEVIARIYYNRRGEQILLLILDAGNFHNPKICYGNSGYTVNDLEDVNILTRNKVFSAHALSLQKQDDRMVILYWLCIDKQIVTWAGQKMIELWSSLLNRKKAGLMVRLEISAPTSRTRAEHLGRSFIERLSYYLTDEEQEYLFGK